MELLAVVVILGIIAALIVPRVIGGTDIAKEKTCLHNRAEINITVEQYYLHTGTWPANDLSDIGADLELLSRRPADLPGHRRSRIGSIRRRIASSAMPAAAITIRKRRSRCHACDASRCSARR